MKSASDSVPPPARDGREAILVVNAGSSSIKFSLFERGPQMNRLAALSGKIDGIGARHSARLTARDAAGATLADQPVSFAPRGGRHHQALEFLLDWLGTHHRGLNITAVGHRIVHGGEHYREPQRVDAALISSLTALVPLAPLHQPHNLDAIHALATLMPSLPQVACFDTAFHRSQPPLAQLFALPRQITAKGVRRYGFHGLSYEYIAHVLPEYLGDAADGRIVVAHLGNGASLCAMKHRRSVATTMGFTAVDGLMMGTRSGSVDPGVLLYLMTEEGWDAAALTHLIYHESGLLGVSGISQDMRELLDSDRAEAREAVDLFCYRALRELGSLAAALDGIDALVFTGGIGVHAAPVRRRICAGARWLGVSLDEAANAANAKRISTGDSAVAVLSLPTNEEWMIARHVARLVQ